MFTADSLATMFGHHSWANLRLLEQCATLSAEQLDSTMLGAYGSIRATLQHIVTAEQSYFSRISTGQPRRRPADAPPMSFAEMIEAAEATGSGLLAWVARVAPDDTVTVDWDGTPREVPKTLILTQTINHATEHRAQVMAMLTQLGIEPLELSGWAYFEATNG